MYGCRSDVEEPVWLCRYIDLFKYLTSQERLPNSDRHKRTVSPPERTEAVLYVHILTVEEQWVLGNFNSV